MARAPRRPIVGVMGSGQRSHRRRTTELGRWLAASGFHLLTGGGGGVMSAVSQAFQEVKGREGLVLGILPADPNHPGRARSGYPNRWVEIPILTHLPLRGTRGAELGSRNPINVLTSDVIVALPGGSGTASEVHLAVAYERPVVAFLHTADEIPGLPDGVPMAPDLEDIRRFVLESLPNPSS